MQIPDYPTNTYKSKEENNAPVSEKRIEKVASGTKTKKKGIRRLGDIFLAEDISSVKSYVIGDVLIPSLKKALDDIVSDGIHMILYGENSSSSESSPASKVSYQKYYDRDREDRRSNNIYSSHHTYEYDDVLLGSRTEAEEVVERLLELADQYGVVSVADFYEMVGITGSHTDNKYGWKSIHDIRDAQILRNRDGYVIKLPRATALD